MNRWKGLFLKEWVQGSREMIPFYFVSVIITFLSLSHVFIGIPADIVGEISSFVGLWFVIHTIYGVIGFLISVGREMKRPDIWLHSPVSVVQLVSAKALFSILTMTCSLVLTGPIIIGSYYSGETGDTISILSSILLLLGVIFVIVLNSVYIMALSFLFWSIYHVLRSRIGWFSIIVTVGLSMRWAYVWGMLWFTEMFNSIKEWGSINEKATLLDALSYNNYIFTGLVPESAVLTIGSLLLYGIFTAVYFITGSILFEKKVRL